MQNIKNCFIVTITALTTISGIFAVTSVLFAQNDSLSAIQNISPDSSISMNSKSIFAFAQERNQSMENIENTTEHTKENTSQVLAAEKYTWTNNTQEMKEEEISSQQEKEQTNKTVSNKIQRDSVTLLLEGKTLPEEDYMHLYDSLPYKITNGHVALKVPCDDNSTTPIQVLIGSPPNMKASSLEIVEKIDDPNMTSTFDDPNFSIPGEQCLYHVNLIPDENITTITDIVLNNTEDEDIEFPPTSSVVIGINELMTETKTNITNPEHISVENNVTNSHT